MAAKKKPDSTARGIPTPKFHEETESQEVQWPEWDDKDLETEKWSAPEGTGTGRPKEKVAIKWPFEDPNGPALLPPSLQHLVTQIKRPSELLPLVDGRHDIHVVSPFRSAKQYLPQHTTEEERSFARMRNLQIAEEFKEPEVSLVTPNTHILQSELMRWLISHMSFLQREPTPFDAHTTRPWDLIYPQRDGKPYYNVGGKYAVKLFWMGTWRRVTVDDTVPLDASGRVLLPRSSLSHELWPMLLAKAVCRISELTYVQAIGHADFGDTNVLQLLTGWVRVPYSLTSDRNLLLDLLNKRCTFPQAVAHMTTDSKEEAFPEESAPAVRVSTPKSAGAALRPIKLLVANGNGSGGGGRESAKPVSAVMAHSNSESAKRRNLGDNLSPDGTPIVLNKTPMVYALYGADAPVNHSDVGLPGRLSHPVRILSCHNIGSVISHNEDFYCEENWVVELESPLVLYSGRGGHNNPLPNWKVVQTILGTSFEREHALQAYSIRLRGVGEPFPPLRFRMLFKDFCALFKGVIVLQKEYDFRFRSTILGSKDAGPTVIVEAGYHNDKDKEAKEQQDASGMDLSQGRPWLLFAHSEGSIDLVVNFSVTQPRSPRKSTLPMINVSDGHPQVFQRIPETGTLELEVFAWQVPSSGKTALRLSTTGTASTILRLPPGRNVFRIVAYIPAVYSISVMADKEFLIASELNALRQMGSCSTKFMHHAFGVIKAIKYIVGQKKEDADEFIRRLAMMHVNTHGIPPDAIFVFWRAFAASLETALFDTWQNPLSEDLPITVGEAWTMLCADLRKEIVNAFGVLKKKNDRITGRGAAAARKKKITRLKAAITIQRMFRGMLGRRIAQDMRQERIQRLRSAALTTWDNVLNNMVDFSMMLFRRMYDISPAAINLFPFAKDEALRATVKDLTAKCEERPEGEWFVLSQDIVKLAENTTVNVRLHIPSQEDMPQASFLLHLIDNDTGEESPTTFGQPVPTTLKVNNRGYTFMTEVRTSAPLPAFPWGLRVISNPEFPTDAARGGMAALTGGVPFRESTGICKPRRETLFRFQLSTQHPEQIVSFQLFLSKGEVPNGVMTLEFYRNDQLMKQGSGPLSALIPFTIIGQPARRESAYANFLPAQPEIRYEYFIVGKLQGEFILDSDEQSKNMLDLSQEVKSAKKQRDKSGNKSRKDKEQPSTTPQLALPQWTLRVHSRDPIIMSADWQREDEIKSTKAAWETCEPGRRERGEQIRLKFLQKANSSEDLLSSSDSGVDRLLLMIGALGSSLSLTSLANSLPPASSVRAGLSMPQLPVSARSSLASQPSGLAARHSLTNIHAASGAKSRASLSPSASFAAIPAARGMLASPRSSLAEHSSPHADEPRYLLASPPSERRASPVGDLLSTSDSAVRLFGRSGSLHARQRLGSPGSASSPPKREALHDQELDVFKSRREMVVAKRAVDRQAQADAVSTTTTVFSQIQATRASIHNELLAVRKDYQQRMTSALLETS